MNEDTRIVIDGDPGAGKTTFIKRLCYIWAKSLLHPEESQAQSVLHPEERDTEDEYLHKYTLVIPIILRLISKQNSLIDLFKSQLQCLNICEICALVNLLESKPNTFLLLLDGYDEYKGQSVISKVINKEECTDILTVTTSRPHAVEQLRRHTSQAVDQHVRLCGFSVEQVQQYISQFFELHNLQIEDAMKLTEILFNQRRKLLEVAKTPIRSEMICIVWAKYGKLGETLADLYELFLVHLITHQKTKIEPDYKHEGEPTEVLEENKELLLLVGKVANTWEKYGRLRIVFNTKELKSVFNNSKTSETGRPIQNDIFNKVIDIGLITKSHPSNDQEKSKWSFPHLTIQEYFVAYFLGNSEDTQFVEEFAFRCKEYKILQRCEVIFMFLCSKYPSVANKILTLLVHEEKDENKCKDLLNFILKVIKYYENSKIDIPLPYCVDIKSIDRQINSSYIENRDEGELLRSSLYSLLESEKRQKKPNLHSLTVCNISQYRDFMDLNYLQRLDVEVGKQEELSMLKQKIQHMKALESLCIEINTRPEHPSRSVESDVSFTGVDLVSSIPTDKLTSLSMTGPDVIKAAADHIQKFTILQQLHIDEKSSNYTEEETSTDYTEEETSTDYTEETRNKLISSLNSNNNIKEVSLCVQDLDDRIIQEKLNMKVKLQVKSGTLRKDSLRKAVSGLDLTGGLYKLDLSDNNLKDEGESLGELMARMTTLRVLDVFACNIHADTVQAMVQTIKEIKVTSSLHTLYMGRYGFPNDNNLHTGGCYLGELISLIPDLYTLDLYRCNLTDTDQVNMSDAVPATTSIHTLNLQRNNLYDSSEGLASLLSHTPNIQALAVGGVDRDYSSLPAPVPSLCRAADAGSLTSLHVLDMSDSELQPGSLELLGQHLQYMNSLQVINLKEIEGVKPEDYQHVYSNLPPPLQHLNVWNIDINQDVYLILEYKDNLNHLHRLNVNLDDSDIELLQEVLEQNNPHIHVYSDDEDTWGMYVTDRDE